MKPYIHLIVLFFCASLTNNAYAQIPNNGFEEWNTQGARMEPGGWWTPNSSITSGSFYPVTRSTDHYPAGVGNYSMRLENNVSLYPNWGSFGLAWTGDISGSDRPVFPITGHPASLCGYYKFQPQNHDTMEIHIRLYKNGVDIGGGAFKNYLSAPDWTPFSFSLGDYTSADSARIMITACYDNDAPMPHGNSVLYIDNLSFDNLITGISPFDFSNGISVFPNPAKDKLNIVFENDTYRRLELKIYNMTGQAVLHESSLNPTLTSINISQLPEGIYCLSIVSEKKEIFNRNLVIIK